MPSDDWHIYLVRTADGRLYTGISTDVDRRFAEHAAAAGRGARALRGQGPLRLVYRDRVGERGLALRLEHRLKRLSKAGKEAIVAAATPAAQLVSRLVERADEP